MGDEVFVDTIPDKFYWVILHHKLTHNHKYIHIDEYKMYN